MAENNLISITDLSEHLKNLCTRNNFDTDAESENDSLLLKNTIEQIEISMIKEALEKTGEKEEKASVLLGITRQGLFKKFKRYRL